MSLLHQIFISYLVGETQYGSQSVTGILTTLKNIYFDGQYIGLFAEGRNSIPLSVDYMYDGCIYFLRD